MNDLKLVVFDMDGTLMDSQDIIYAAMTHAFQARALALPRRTDVLSIVGLSLHEAVARLAPQLGEADLSATAEAYKQSFIALRKKTGGEASAPLYPGALSALDWLNSQDDVVMGVATGKAKRGLEHALDAHGLQSFFVTRQTADHHPSKPHPSMLLSALSETGVAADRAIMIGDTSFDMEMGRAAGFRTLGVTWGYHSQEALRAAGADLLVDGFAELPEALAKLWEQSGE